MATVNVNGATTEVVYTFPTAQAAEFKSDLIEIFGLDPQATAVEVADRIALQIRERIRRHRREKLEVAAGMGDPGTVDFV